MTIKLDTFRVLRLICPSCQSVAAVRRQRQMISLAPSGKSPPLVSAGPRLLKRGASRSSRTLVRAAMDASCAPRRSAWEADGEVVWSWPLDAEVNSRQCFALRGDGDNKARSPGSNCVDRSIVQLATKRVGSHFW